MESSMVKNKIWFWVLIAAILIAGAAQAWRRFSRPAIVREPSMAQERASAEIPLSGGDTTADIQKDLGAIDFGDVNQELNQLDADINKL